jgi:hypothetical protein
LAAEGIQVVESYIPSGAKALGIFSCRGRRD